MTTSPTLPHVMGHRGAAAVAPENTLASIRRAGELGVAWVEFDVMLTGDDCPVLFHDDSLKRITGTDAMMADLPLGRVSRLDAGAWFDSAFEGEPIPTLQQALALVGRQGLYPNIEIKPTFGRDVVTATRLVESLCDLWPDDVAPPFISSFSRMSLAAVRALRPKWPLGLIAWSLPEDWKEAAQALDCVSVHLAEESLTADTIGPLREAGYQVAAFTVNDGPRARSLLAMGVDSLITDDPGHILAEIGAETDRDPAVPSGDTLRNVAG